MNIIFENNFFIAVDKPAMVLTVPARDRNDQRPVLGLQIQDAVGKNIFPIHRLDYEVSGLVLFAKDPKAHRDASILFEGREVKKTYQCFSLNSSFKVGEQGTWAEKILRGKKRTYASPAGKLAVTDFILHNKYDSVEYALSIDEWRLFPRTGRSHQLRWEMYRHEVPILGDELYGSKIKWKELGIALRAIELSFPDKFAKMWEVPQNIRVPELVIN